jgi:murein DD-endopeptidase MepM/ murein hydrolase activator NlpD
LTNWLCFSPEKNLYEHLLTQKISKKQYFIPISAPVKGEWRISQAFDGSVTHKGEWRFAWDFVKTDEQHRTSKNQPKKPNDFFCYDGEIFAPASGYVTDVKEGIEDNPLGKINAEENWGNALVIKHAEGLYSCIAHFKKGSLTAKIGDYVYAGQFLGVCGNSGYSYEPHVHFQLQALNYIGAPTIEYPLFMYRETNQAQIFAAEYGFPQLNSFVETAFPYPDFAAAFSFFAGSVFRWTKEKGGKTEELTWFVGGDAFNGWYLWCQNSSSFAYFHHDGFFVRFTKFFGDKKSELFDFFLLSQKILLRFAENVTCRESVNFYDYVPFYWLYLQDFTAFFWQFLSAEFVLRQREMNENERFFSFETKFSVRAFGNEISQKEAFFDIKEGFIDGFILSEQGKTMYSLKRKIK